MHRPFRFLVTLAATAAVAAVAACGSDHRTGPASTGTILGAVTSTLGGGLHGASVTVIPTGQQAMTATAVSNTGGYRIADVPLAGGRGTITVSGTPTNCRQPTPTPYTGLTGGDSITVDVSVDCTVLVGSVTGTVTSQVAGIPTAIPNAKVVVTPTGGTAPPASTTAQSGQYLVTSVPVGTGAGMITLSSLPSNCSTPPGTAYSGLVSGGTVTANVAVTCTPTTGNLTVTLSQPSGLGGGGAVIGPTGTVYSVDTTETLAGLAAGSYRVTAPSSVLVPGAIVNSVYTSGVAGSPVAVTVGATATASITYTLRTGSGSAWVTNQDGTGVQLTAAQLASSGSPTPPVKLSGLAAANALAFDNRGNLWIAGGSSGNDQIVEYGSAELAATGSPVPTLTITSTNHTISLPQQLTFDLTGNLWVANQKAGTIVEFTAPQLTVSGSHTIVPAVTLTSADWGANTLGTIAFDVQGTLWAYGFTGGKIGVYGYAGSTLSGSGAVTPTVTLTNAAFTAGPQTLAFDPAGDLWVTTNGSIVEFTPAELVAGGAQAAASTVAVPGSGTFVNAAGFDDGGDLWLAVGGNSAVIAFSPAQLASGGSPTPAITIASNAGSLSHPTAIGFDPHGVGVPLAGSRIPMRLTPRRRAPLSRPLLRVR